MGVARYAQNPHVTTTSHPLAASIQAFYEPTPGYVGDVSTHPLAVEAARLMDAGFAPEVWTTEHRHRPYTEAALAELAALCRTVPLATTHTGIDDWDPAGLGREIAISARLGAKVHVIHCAALSLDRGGTDWPAVRDLAAQARAGGLRLGLENSGKFGINLIRRALDTLGDDPDSSGLGLCIDVGHAHRSRGFDGAGPADYLAEFSRAILELHLHDNFGTDDLHLVPGEGSIDWTVLGPALARLPERAIFCIEIEYRGRPLEDLTAARQFVRQATGGD